MSPATHHRVLSTCTILLYAALIAAAGCSTPAESSAERSAPRTTAKAAAEPRNAQLRSVRPLTMVTIDPPPKPDREFRGVFVTSAYNLDWPSRPGLHWRAQRDEIRAIVDRTKAMNCNVIILQVRAFADRIHRGDEKTKEKWAEALNRTADPHHGNPNKRYDPLAEWIDAAHEAGLQLHIWVNPYRTDYAIENFDIIPSTDGFHMYLSPTELAAQTYIIQQIAELLDYKFKPVMPKFAAAEGPFGEPQLASAQQQPGTPPATTRAAESSDGGGPDGVLIDHDQPPPPPDPEPTTKPAKRAAAEPTGAAEPAGDAALAAQRVPSATTKAAAEEEETNPKKKRIKYLVKKQGNRRVKDTTLDAFIQRLSALCNEKQVKFGISPKRGSTLYRGWLTSGFVDYAAPELEMRMTNQTERDQYDAQLKMWLKANTFTGGGRTPIVVAGLNTVAVQFPPPQEDETWDREEILEQVKHAKTVAEGGKKASGQAHYLWSALRTPEQGGPPPGNNFGNLLTGADYYPKPALVPQTRSGAMAEAPKVVYDPIKVEASWSIKDQKDVRFWAIWLRTAGQWGDMRVVRERMTKITMDGYDGIAVMAIDPFDRVSPVTAIGG